MHKLIPVIFTIFIVQSTFSQSIDALFSVKKMKKDLSVFKEIRTKANSGLYKYRTKKQIDSIYNWAFSQVEKSDSYRDFYNIICKLTDFEGSLHNDTTIPKKISKSIKNETKGYFPYPIKIINGKAILNIENTKIPLGAEVLTINNKNINKILVNLYKYYTTDGLNITGKSIGINYGFSKYYRLHYGLKDSFTVTYKPYKANKIENTILKSISNKSYYKNVENRYSKPFDNLDYLNYNEMEERYTYKKIDKQTAILSINTFVIGWNAEDKNHKIYVKYLDSIFSSIKTANIRNLIIDVRHNGGGTDPNDLVTYSYLTQRNFSENKQAWISFNKIPCLKYIESNIPAFLRPLGVGKYNKEFRQDFPLEKNSKYYQTATSFDHKIRVPNKNAFNGNIYLLISSRTASAASLFAAMVAGNKNATIIGEETMGGYYGHNGHIPLTYILPKSKIAISFSVVNLEQDVPKKSNQIYNRGIIPDYKITQNIDDYLKHKDVQMNFVLDLINKDVE